MQLLAHVGRTSHPEAFGQPTLRDDRHLPDDARNLYLAHFGPWQLLRFLGVESGGPQPFLQEVFRPRAIVRLFFQTRTVASIPRAFERRLTQLE